MRRLLALMLPLVVVMCTAPAVWADTIPVIEPYGSRVTAEVTGNTPWTYEFTVWNASPDNQASVSAGTSGAVPVLPPGTIPIIVDWELPYFNDAGIDNIMSPTGWFHAIETIGVANPLTGWGGVANWQDPLDPWYEAGSSFSTVKQVLHWYTLSEEGDGGTFWRYGIDPQDFLGGFSFTADYDETPAPYQASWAFLAVQTGDPPFPGSGLPASPLTLASSAVPLPGAGMMGMVLLGAFLAARLVRRKS